MSQEARSPVPRHPRSARWRGFASSAARRTGQVRPVAAAVPIVTPMAAVLDAGVAPAAAGVAFELAEGV